MVHGWSEQRVANVLAKVEHDLPNRVIFTLSERAMYFECSSVFSCIIATCECFVSNARIRLNFGTRFAKSILYMMRP